MDSSFPIKTNETEATALVCPHILMQILCCGAHVGNVSLNLPCDASGLHFPFFSPIFSYVLTTILIKKWQKAKNEIKKTR